MIVPFFKKKKQKQKQKQILFLPFFFLYQIMSSKEWKKPPANIMSLFSLHHQQQLQEQEQPPICVKEGGGSVTKTLPGGERQPLAKTLPGGERQPLSRTASTFRSEGAEFEDLSRTASPLQQAKQNEDLSKAAPKPPPKAASLPALRAGVEDLPSPRSEAERQSVTNPRVGDERWSVTRDSGVSHHRRRGEEVTLEKIQVIKRSLAQLQQQIMELESDIIVEKGKTKTQHKGGKPIKPPKPPQKKEKKGFASQKKHVSPAMYSFLLSQGFKDEKGKIDGEVEGEANQVSHFSRTFLLQSIHAYIKTHSLQHPQKKTTFMVDSVLQELFPPSTTSEGGEGESQTIRYFDLPRLLSAHIIG